MTVLRFCHYDVTLMITDKRTLHSKHLSPCHSQKGQHREDLFAE